MALSIDDLVKQFDTLIRDHFPGAPDYVVKVVTVLGLAALVATICKPLVAPVKSAWRLFIEPHFRSHEVKQLLELQRDFSRHLAKEILRLNQAEDWRDGNFVDLEAEVEVESKPRRSLFSIARSTTRREKSVTVALKRSKEPQILLEGDPGSGKSVALRHFALQLAEAAAGRPHPNNVLPVFVNLKELRREANEAIGPDLILEHARHALNRTKNKEVAKFIAQQFETRLRAGTWIFLFDSFDEIPDILSSTENDDIIARYSAAIDDFFSGMNNCRGVIASRRYQGPRRYVWCLFRLVELTLAQQNRLITRLLGDRPDREGELFAGLKTASDDVRVMTRNPMLLSLLCQHIKAGHNFPTTGYDVFSHFVAHRLARDEAQVLARFGATSARIAEIAEIVAFTMTADIAIGLSPTRAELAAAVRRQAFNLETDELGRVLDALEYMRLAKVDPEARADSPDRQFSFSHRRFQEYFATRIVVATPERVSPAVLLMDARWRETAIVLCQHGGGERAIEGVLQEASRLVASWQAELSGNTDAAPPAQGTPVVWPHKAYHVLSILQAGFAEVSLVPVEEFRELADLFLVTVFNSGDRLDKKLVLEIAGIVHRQRLLKFLQAGLSIGSEWVNDVIFRQVARLPSASGKLGDWIRAAIVRQAFSKDFGGPSSSMRAFAARLPNGRRMQWIATFATSIKQIDLMIFAVLTALTLFLRGWQSSEFYFLLTLFAVTTANALLRPKALPGLYWGRVIIGHFFVEIEVLTGSIGSAEAAVVSYGLLWAPLAVLLANMDLVARWVQLPFIPILGCIFLLRSIARLVSRIVGKSPAIVRFLTKGLWSILRRRWQVAAAGLIVAVGVLLLEKAPASKHTSSDIETHLDWSLLLERLKLVVGAFVLLGLVFWLLHTVYSSIRDQIARRRIKRWLDQSEAGLDGEAISDRLSSLTSDKLRMLILAEVSKRNLLRASEGGEAALRHFAATTKSGASSDIAFRLAESINTARQ